jgi:hypothetical protein
MAEHFSSLHLGGFELDLRDHPSVRVGGGWVSLHGTEVSLTTALGDGLRLRLPGLARSDDVCYWTDGERLLLVGRCDRSVVLADPRAGYLEVIGELEQRLDVSGKCDPGRLERVGFVVVSTERVAVVHELGMAVADLAGRSLLWERTTGDIGRLFHEVSGGVAWFEGHDGGFGFHLDDGALRLPGG